VHYTTEEDLKVNGFIRDAAWSEGGSYLCHKEQEYPCSKHDVIISSSWGQRISEHIHSEGGYYVTADTQYRHLAERTNEQRVASVLRNQIADYGTV